jgi:hypothetical protein
MLGIDEQEKTGMFGRCQTDGSDQNKGCLWEWDGSIDMKLDFQVGCRLGLI